MNRLTDMVSLDRGKVGTADCGAESVKAGKADGVERAVRVGVVVEAGNAGRNFGPE